jgi:hypothetical protein
VLEKRSKTAPLLGAVSASQLVGRVLPKT